LFEKLHNFFSVLILSQHLESIACGLGFTSAEVVSMVCHRSISYKEQARLNQAACNALMARLDCQKTTCETAEKDLLQRYSQRQALATLASMELSATEENKLLKGRDIVDVSSCLSLLTTSEGQFLSPDKELLEQDTIGLCSESEDGDIANAHRTNINHRGSVDPMKAQQKQEHFEETHSDKENAGRSLIGLSVNCKSADASYYCMSTGQVLEFHFLESAHLLCGCFHYRWIAE
jgi:hypothetical protein